MEHPRDSIRPIVGTIILNEITYASDIRHFYQICVIYESYEDPFIGGV